MAKLKSLLCLISSTRLLALHINKQHVVTKPQCFCSTNAATEFLQYSKEDIKTLDRKNLQLICSAIGVSRGIKTTAMIEEIVKHMDKESLPVLSFFPFQSVNKSYQEIDSDMQPLSIKIESEKVYGLNRVYEGRFPSVTTVLGATKSKKSLEQLSSWRKRELELMGVEHFTKMEQDTFDAGAKLHEVMAEWLIDYHTFEKVKAEDFKKNCSLFRTKQDRLDDRENFIIKTMHKYISKKGQENKRIYNQIVSLIQVFKDIDQVLAVESGTVHKELMYAGTVDCLAVFRDSVCLIDWKTTKRPRRSLQSCYDYPVQLAAYVAAINADPAYPFKVENAALVFAHNNSTEADVHVISLEKLLPYYYEWQGRLQMFQKNFYKTDFTPCELNEDEKEIFNFLPDNYEETCECNISSFIK